ncbi:hypothetical protein EV194_11740 [Natronoflexus pectinivorans]|uniref:Uncharacterized protein n=1 Tax=Natronoflexus pectinivorans TaxID=682526 RepID=A0A4R2GAK0_9BACT|nr:hypothetical protein EV194_11740 [Natronoflexus pectinivorans]
MSGIFVYEINLINDCVRFFFFLSIFAKIFENVKNERSRKGFSLSTEL